MANKNPRKGTPEYAYLQLSKETDNDVKRLVSSLRFLRDTHKPIAVRFKKSNKGVKLDVAGSAVYRLIKIFKSVSKNTNYFYYKDVQDWLRSLARMENLYLKATSYFSDIARADVTERAREKRTEFLESVDNFTILYEKFIASIKIVLSKLLKIDKDYFSHYSRVFGGVVKAPPRFKVQELHDFVKQIRTEIDALIRADQKVLSRKKLNELNEQDGRLSELEALSNPANSGSELIKAKKAISVKLQEYRNKLNDVLEDMERNVSTGEQYLRGVNDLADKVFTLGAVITEINSEKATESYKKFMAAIQDFKQAIHTVLKNAETLRKSEHYAHEAIVRRALRGLKKAA